MADTAVVTETSSPATPAKKTKASAAAKKPKAKPTHPKTSEMVNSAIKDLKERSGSSLQAIKKYISAQYKVDAEKLAPFIRKYLKGAVESGALIQTKGKGASGSFKLEAKGTGKKAPAVKASPSKSKAAAPAKKKKPAAAKPEKKAAVAAASKKKTAPSPKKATAASKTKSAAPKAKKTAKPPTKKPKAPKPKKAAASKAKTTAGAKKTAKK